jgi:PST family polysaccharide transporter
MTALTARTAARTATLQVVARGATLVVALVATGLVTRALGSDGFADWATVLSLQAMVGFALDPGITPVIVRRLAQDRAASPAPGALLACRLVLAIVALLVVVGLSVALRGADVLVLALVLAGQLLPRALTINVGTWMQAEHRLHRQTLLEGATSAVGVVALAAAVAADAGAPVLALVGILVPALALAALMRRELGRLESARATPTADEWARVRSVLREAAPVAGAVVLVAVYTRLDTVFVNAAESTVAIADYLLAKQFVEQLVILAGIGAGTLLPLIAARAASHDVLADRAVHGLLIAVAVTGAAVSLGLIALAEPLVALLGGSEREGAAPLLVLLAPVAVGLFGNFFLGYLLMAVQLGGRYLRFNLAGLAVSVATGLALTLPFGAEAAARALWATEIVVAGLAALGIARGGSSGRRAAGLAAASVGVAILASELVFAGVPRVLVVLVGAALLAGLGLAGWREGGLQAVVRGGAASARS